MRSMTLCWRRRADARLAADHWAFALFLPGAELTLHASLHPANASERQMLFEALDLLEPGRDLLVLDRGYPGCALAAWLAQAHHAFCMRADGGSRRCVREFLRSGQTERWVGLAAPSSAESATYQIERRPTRVRLIRDVTPGGQVRVLMTNLLDPERFPAPQFGGLYHRR